MRVSQFVVALRKAISGVGEDALLTRAAAIAFYSALSFAPLIVLLLWVLAALRPEWQGQLTDGLASMLGEKAAGAKLVLVQEVRLADRVLIAARVTIAVVNRAGRPRRLPTELAAKLGAAYS